MVRVYFTQTSIILPEIYLAPVLIIGVHVSVITGCPQGESTC